MARPAQRRIKRARRQRGGNALLKLRDRNFEHLACDLGALMVEDLGEKCAGVGDCHVASSEYARNTLRIVARVLFLPCNNSSWHQLSLHKIHPSQRRAPTPLARVPAPRSLPAA